MELNQSPWRTSRRRLVRICRVLLHKKRHSFMEWHFLWCHNRSQTADSQPLTVRGAVSRVSPVGCPPKVEAGEGVMSKGVYGTIVPCTTIANLTEQSEIVAECQPSGLFSEGENEAEAC